MSLFNKTKKYRKPSHDIDEKVKSLNKELEKTGLIVEVGPANSTKHVYNTFIYHPATDMEFTDVPDPGGVRSDGWTQPSNGYNASDSSTWSNAYPNTDWLYNPNEVGGETNKPVVVSPDTPPTGQTIGRFGPGGGLIRATIGHGMGLGYLKSDNTYQGILWNSYWGTLYAPTESNRYGSEAPYRGYTDEEYAFMQSAHSKMLNTTFTKEVKFWTEWSYFWYGSWEGYAGTKKEVAGGARYVLKSGYISGDPNKYQSQDNAPPYHEVLNRYPTGDPNYYPGDVSGFLAWLKGKLELSDQGWARLEDELLAFGMFSGDGKGGVKINSKDLQQYNWYKQSGDDSYIPAGADRDALEKEWQKKYGNQSSSGGGDYNVASNTGRGSNRGKDYDSRTGETKGITTDSDWGKRMRDAVYGTGNIQAKSKKGKTKTWTLSYEPEGTLIKEGWASPEHVNVDKNEKKRWFNPKEIHPEYPREEPPEIVNGYSEKMFPKLDTPIPYIKVKRKDLIRAHKLKKHEAQEYVDLVNKLNDYIKRNPHRLAYIRER